MPKYLITGGTGNIGKYVVQELLAMNKDVKVAVRDLQQATNICNDPKAKFVKFDFLDSATFAEALDEVGYIFLVRPPQLANPQKDMLPFLKAAKDKGIQKIVFISLLGVEQNPVVPHRKIENIIQKLEIPYVFLRPSFFMQNLNTNHQEEIQCRNEIYIPAGKAKTSFIDTRDIARAAAVTLTEKQYRNQGITLTGKTAIDYYEIADIMTNVLGRKITYKNPSLLAFRTDRINRGAPKEFANIMTLLYLMTKLGTAKSTTKDLEKIIGREPILFEKYTIDHQTYWMR